MPAAALVVLLLVVGFALLAMEILVIPGFGVVGVLGIVAILGGALLAWTRLGSIYGVLAFGGGMVTAVLMIWLFPKTGAGKAMVLSDQHRAGQHAGDPALAALHGKDGVALTPLRPSGAAAIEDLTVDVVTDGVYVERGQRIRVVRVAGGRVVVAPVETERVS